MASTGVCSPAQNWRLKLASDGAPELERLVDWRREQFRDAIKFFRTSLAVLRALPAGIILGSTSILSAIKIQLHSELFGCLKGPHRLRRPSDRWARARRPVTPKLVTLFCSASTFDHLYRYGLTGHYLASNLRSYLKPSAEGRSIL